ncbi:DUF4328 domain-containing protein [Sphingosinicella terrae]|jgi:hypothetical protein|uniref:DUF4328 domain-containing protein n=1 Tax=Sphingosinicella terrae TaxID=2172047 RepID=UPI000E0DA9F9|nr:DUF4328 domain-containing protein [Sphingosinicella terrae]
MHVFKDPSGATRMALIFVWANMAAQGLVTALSLYLYRVQDTIAPETLVAVGFAQLTCGLVTIAAIVFVAIWIYRVSANAHAISEEMTISPGWAVGWYFIPIANLFKPFQAMKETWLASHFRGNWHGEPAPALLGWWWALWVSTSLLSNISMRITFEDPDALAPPAVVILDVVIAILTVPLTIVLVSIMQRLAAAQLYARHDETFA